MARLLRRGKRKFRGRAPIRKKMKRAIRSGQGITSEFDRRTIYRKKSMGRGKRRVWTKFVRKVNAVGERTLGTKTIVMNNLLTASGAVASTGNTVMELALYPLDALTGTDVPPLAVDHLKDISKIVANEANVADIIGPTTKFLFQSGVLDLTIQNLSINSAVFVGMELDIYEIIASKNFDVNVAHDGGAAVREQGTLLSCFSEADLATTVIGAGTSLSLGNRGVTPFDIPMALSQYGIKILKKTKYQLNAQQVLTYQIRDPRRHVISKYRADPSTNASRPRGVNLPGWTRHLLLIGKSYPGNTDSQQCVFSAGITRKYMYKLMNNSLTKDAGGL